MDQSELISFIYCRFFASQEERVRVAEERAAAAAERAAVGQVGEKKR
jgi:hypothetical protein